jgi:TolB-like protein/class 3 adenylate cyclase/Flp pilus assembly protein TadD
MPLIGVAHQDRLFSILIVAARTTFTAGDYVAHVKRKMATLLAANVVDYSRLMATSELESLESLKGLREILNRLVGEYGGRQFGIEGDARTVEFPSAHNALLCAIGIQKAIVERNDALPADEHIQLRIGLNVGEVLEGVDGNLHGDGINVATNLQTLAAPGGICISGSMHDHVKNYGQFEQAGERQFENARDPVHVYHVVAPGVNTGRLSFWEELKQRNVVRVGAAYAVVAWLLLQVAATILPSFDAPQWIMRALFLALVIGFPVSLFLAWVYEITPLGLMRNEEALREPDLKQLTGRRVDSVIIGLLAAAVIYLIFDNYDLLHRDAEPAPYRSIAVLAFENLSFDTDNDYFADGISDELLNVLARIPELRVASRTSSFSFKGKNIDVATIAETLQVDNVLEGSVRAHADQIRVTATLVQDGSILWTETYDRGLNDILDVQSEIAYAVATAITPVLSTESETRVTRRPTDNVEAYDYYLRGLDYLNRPAEESTLSIAASMFDRAIDLDPRFASAWAARCKTRLNQYEFSAADDNFFNDAQSDCRRAWTLENDLWDVYVALGRLYRISGLYDNAIDELETAVAQQPNAVEAYLELGNAYSETNRTKEAQAMFAKAIAVDRGNWQVHRAYGHFYYDNERYDKAIEQYSLVAEFAPDSGVGFDNLGNAYWAIGDFENAAQAFKDSLSISPSRWAYSSLGSMQYYLGDYTSSVENQLLSIELAPEDHVAWGRLAEAYRLIPGAEDKALPAFAKAIELVREDLLVNPDHWDNLGQLAIYLAFSGQHEEAAAQAQKMLAIAPADPSAHYYEALVKWQRRDVDATYQAIQSALELGMSAVFIARDPTLAPLREEVRFQALISGYES